MRKMKEQILRLLQQNSDNRAAKLSMEYIRADPDEKEAIVAGIEFEKWLSQVCEDCLN
jgi:hypothetical protein